MYLQRGPPEPSKYFVSPGKIRFFEKSAFEVNIDFLSHVDTNLAPFWDPKSIQIHPKWVAETPLLDFSGFFVVLERVVFSMVFGIEKSGSKISKNLTKVVPSGDRGDTRKAEPRPRRGEGGK